MASSAIFAYPTSSATWVELPPAVSGPDTKRPACNDLLKEAAPSRHGISPPGNVDRRKGDWGCPGVRRARQLGHVHGRWSAADATGEDGFGVLPSGAERTAVTMVERTGEVTTRPAREANAAQVWLPSQAPCRKQTRSPLEQPRVFSWLDLRKGPGRKPCLPRSAASWDSESQFLEPSRSQARDRPRPELGRPPGSLLSTCPAPRDQHLLRLQSPPERGS